MTGEWFDAYLSFAPADEERARRIAAEMRETGLAVHIGAAEPGEQTVLVSDSALARSRAAIVIVSSGGTLGRTPDYAAIMALHASGRLRVVPVVLDAGATLPPKLATLEPVSFARVDSGQAHAAVLRRLVAAVRGDPPRPAPTAVPDYDRSAGGPIRATLRVDIATTTLLTPRAAPLSVPHATTAALIRHRFWLAGDRSEEDLSDDLTVRATGEILGSTLLPGPVGPALAQLVADADRGNRALELGIEAAREATDFATLPWERLVVPDMNVPLVLHRVARVHRHVGGLGETPATVIPGPLRILAAIAAPDGEGHRVLDYEHELATILRQVDEAHRKDAYIRILNSGSLEAIRAALNAERFHVLHISCHARPGCLELETRDGGLDEVKADTFIRNLVLPGRDVPLVVLAGCSTALAPGDLAGLPDDAAALPGFARALLEHGVPAVLAMTRSVGDHYATELLARAYRELSDRPDPLAVLSDVRRTLEDESPGSGEWATAALFTRVRFAELFDPAAPRPEVTRPAVPRVGAGIIDLDPGDFVGRRTDLRRLLRVLQDGHHTGVLIHGTGGIGKSSLAVQLVMQLGVGTSGVVMLHGRRTVDDMLEVIGRHLRIQTIGRQQPEDREIAEAMVDRSAPWNERLDVLAELVLPKCPLLLLLDDPIGDPLEEGSGPAGADPEAVLDPEVFDFIDAWLGLRGARLILTTRNRSLDPERELGNHRRLIAHHLGLLTAAEADKLFWRLPALRRLDTDERAQVYHALGGHPRVLEYLDALLRREDESDVEDGGPKTRRTYRVVTERIRRANAAHGGSVQCRPRSGNLDDVVSEASAVASAEVLLDQLRTRLEASDPVAAQLFVAASVYRQPVDDAGLNWMVSDDPGKDPARSARLLVVHDALVNARAAAPRTKLATLRLPGEQRAQLNRDLFALTVLETRHELPVARRRLVDLTLLTPVDSGPDQAAGYRREPRYLVHRWTARRLGELVEEETIRASHRRAAAYRRWHAKRYPEETLQDLEEARYHYWMAGERDHAVGVARDLCAALHSHGAYWLEYQVCADTLARLGPDDPRRRIFLHFQAVVATALGDLDVAERQRRACLELAEDAGDQAGVAASLQQLGVIAQFRGDATAAEDNYRAVVQASSAAGVSDQAVIRAVLASSYLQLCALRVEAGDPEAWRFSAGAAKIVARLDDEADLAEGLADLERLALAAGDARLAAEHAAHGQEARSLRLDVHRMRVASVILTAAVSVLRNEPQRALGQLEKAAQEADGPLLAKCVHLAADAQFELGAHAEAAVSYRLFARLADELGDAFGVVLACQQLGRLATETGDQEWAEIWLERARVRAVELGNPNLLGWTLLYVGSASVARGQDDAAQRELIEAQAIADRVGNDALWCAAGVELGARAARQRDIPEATALFGFVLNRAGRLNNRRAVVACCIALGMLAQQDERFPEAARWFDSGHRHALAAGDQRAAAGCLLHAGRLASQEGRHADAEAVYRECLGLLRPPAHADLRLAATVELGRCRMAQNDPAEAARTLGSVSADDRAFEIPPAHLRRLVLLSRAQAAADDDDAETVSRRCAEVAAAVAPSPLTAVAFLAAGEEHFNQDETTAAHGHFATAFVAAESVGPAGATLVADCLWWLAAVARATEDHAAAARHLERALALADDRHDRVAAMHVLRELGRVARDAGDPERARRYLVESAARAGELGPLYVRARAACQLLIADLDRRAGRTDEAAALRAHARTLARMPEPRLPVRVDNDLLMTTTTRGWHDLLWQRRLIAVEGELAFGGSMETLLGPSLDETLRDLSPRRSALATLASVVLMIDDRLA